jgi:hypothetical protein
MTFFFTTFLATGFSNIFGRQLYVIVLEYILEYFFVQFFKIHCKHLQRSQSHSVELIFAPLLEKFLD